MFKLNNIRIGNKLLLSFGLLVTLAALITATAFYGLYNIVGINKVLDHFQQIDTDLFVLNQAEKDFVLWDINDPNYFKIKNNQHLVKFNAIYSKVVSELNSLLNNEVIKGHHIDTPLRAAYSQLINYQKLFSQLITLTNEKHSLNLNQAAGLAINKAIGMAPSEGVMGEMHNTFDLLNAKFDESMKAADNLVHETTQHTRELLIMLFLLEIIAGGFLTYLMTWAIATPLKQLSTYAQQFADGNLEVTFPSHGKDEIGKLSDIFRASMQAMHDLAESANKIGTGSFEVEIQPRSEKDVLAKALIKMRDSLKQLDSKNKHELWIKTQIAQISNLSQGIRNLQILSQTVINEIAKLLKVGCGVFYIMQSTSNASEKELRLLGSYAYVKRKNLSNRFKLGEGLVGQCALEKKPILLTEVPADYIHISSGLGDKPPLNILVMPITHEDQVLGVFELALFHVLTEDEQNFLSELAQTLGIIINNVINLQKTEELLKESRSLTEELQTQQEELRSTNEELAEKSQVLKKSEEELKVQSEELQTINEELEEKTSRLTQQNVAIEKQNQAIAKARDEVEQRAKELAQASKYKSEFLANMSHELRTPLNSLLLLAKNLQDNKEGNLSSKQVEAANVIYNGGKDLLNLINDILDLSKVEAGHLQINIAPVKIQEICNNLKIQFEPIAHDKHINFIISVARDVPAIIVSDAQRILQILKNLVANACKFTQHGSVRLEISKAHANTHFKNPDLSYKNTLAWSVIDTGIGIAKSKQQAIFEAFQQADGSTSRTYGGTGLGLSISKVLAELLGGEIVLESQENQGSTFTLYLPINLPIETQAKTPIEHAEESFLPDDRNEITPKTKSLLIMDDDKEFVKILMAAAKQKGFLTIASGLGHEGYELAKRYQPTGIILDLGLPDIDGTEILKELKSNKRTHNIPVHIISGREEAPEVRQKGAIGYLLKPASVEEVNDVFNKIEAVTENKIKRLLLVAADRIAQQDIINLIKDPAINIDCAAKTAEVQKKLSAQSYDCLLLDLQLPDQSGIKLLKELKALQVHLPPVVIYTNQELTEAMHNALQEYSSSIIIKSAASYERLLDEISLFFHGIESNLPTQTKLPPAKFATSLKILQGKKILLVDDDMRNVFALSSILEEQGLNIVIAANGKMALEKLQETEDINLILMDIMMPEMDGYEAIKRIREIKKYKNLPIVALTAKAMKDDKVKCLNAGANDYITKPIDTEQLLSLLKIWLSNEPTPCNV